MADVDLRPSSIAGQWYEADQEALAKSVDRYLDQAKLPKLDGDVIGVVAPHAGHMYSGPVAGYAFAAIRDRSPDLVVVVSPVHPPKWSMPAAYFEPVLTSSHPGYRTPLGDIPIDAAAVKEINTKLIRELGKGLSPVSHDPEHSLEIELPFLQRALKPGWKLLPIMMHTIEPRTSEILGKVIASVVKGKNYLLVASTDLSHFYDQETAKKLDAAMLAQVEAFSPEGVFETERSGKGFACGLSALASVLWAGRELGADRVTILQHATSGDVIGDYSSVVGYGAAAILKH
jgi:hypothetical protein